MIWKGRAGGKGEFKMKAICGMAVWVVAGGLLLWPAAAGWGQQGSGQGLPSAAQGSGSSTGQGAGTGQTGGSQSGKTSTVPSLGSDEVNGTPSKYSERELENLRNGERQKKLVADTEKLLALANQLKEDVDKSTKDTLSLDVVRKADEIEKLAHSVKEKMKGS